jgi:hypothetical protein
MVLHGRPVVLEGFFSISSGFTTPLQGGSGTSIDGSGEFSHPTYLEAYHSPFWHLSLRAYSEYLTVVRPIARIDHQFGIPGRLLLG